MAGGLNPWEKIRASPQRVQAHPHYKPSDNAAALRFAGDY